MPIFNAPRTQFGRGRPVGALFLLSGPGFVFGDSLTSLVYQANPDRWGHHLSGKPPKVVVNFGIPTETLTDMLARVDANIATALSYGCRWVICRMGTNGAGTGDFQTKFLALVNKFRDAGLLLILLQIPPTSATGQPLVDMNAWIKSIADSDPAHVGYVADSWVLSDPVYVAKAAMFDDHPANIHHSALGQYTSGRAQAGLESSTAGQGLLPWLPDPGVITDGTDTYQQNPGSSVQFIDNPLMTGTGGTTPSGQAPNGFDVSATNGTAASSIVASWDSNPAPWLKLDLLTGVGSNTAFGIAIHGHNPVISSNLTTPIALFDSMMEIRYALTDTSALDKITFGSVDHTNGFTGYGLQARWPGPAINEQGVLRDALRRVNPPDAGWPANDLSLLLYITGALPFGSPIGSIYVRRPSLRAMAQ